MSEQQVNLFGDEAAEPAAVGLSRSLRVVPQGAAPLSKGQRAFNRLLAQIERLRQEVVEQTSRLDQALAVHVETLHPLHRQVSGLRKEVARLLATFLKTKPRPRPALTQAQRKTLKSVVLGQLQAVANEEGGLADADLRVIHEEFSEENYDGEEDEDEIFASVLREQLKAALEKEGMSDVDFSKLRPDMSLEEMHAMMEELMGRLSEGREDGAAKDSEKAPKKTKRELAREDKERQMAEARARNIGSIYKQLVRALHPDLEPDPARRQEKEALMKELTVAYKQNDLHTLLRLELAWLQRREDDASRLSEEKLAIYNAVLSEQVETLKTDLESLPMQARYGALQRYGGMLEPWGLNVPAETAQAKAMVTSLRDAIRALRGADVTAEIRELIRVHRFAERRRAQFDSW